ncbi:uncharacterized protein NPIL_693191 [Nephila pilipes]|uniref:Uncharacterized protein n=1 Tax=Nephila pilipes TaxID=299642 RepID=A0A8X6P279_NEPPI|nr:uncharacterized protein NPIL_693191 [Nephila pilipes]
MTKRDITEQETATGEYLVLLVLQHCLFSEFIRAMIAEGLLISICLAITATPCQSDKTNSTFISGTSYMRKQALDTYKTTCVRLQHLANWMSVLFKLLSAWTDTTTKTMIENRKLEANTEFRNIPPIPERPAVGTPGLECSLKNLQVTLKTYIHFQTQLMQLKNILGKRILQTSKEKLNVTNVSLQRKIGNLDSLNKTAMEMFEKLKQSSQSLISQGNERNLPVLSVIKHKHLMPSFFSKLFPREEETIF